MRILFLTRLFYPHIGGVEKHVWEIAKLLQREGHSITILCERHDKTLTFSEVIDGIQIQRFDPHQNEKLKKFTIWFYIFKNISLIRNADIVHIHDVFFWYLPFSFLFPAKKVFLTSHGYEGFYPIKKSAIQMRLLAQKFTKGTIAVGKYIDKWYGTKSDFITYGGIHPVSYYQTTGFGKSIKILLLGRLDKDNGVEVYLEALQELRDKKIQFELTVCGDGEFKKKFEQISEVIGFTNDIEHFLKESDIVFASSYLSILEALNYKKHVFSVFTNPLKEDYLKMTPFSLYIHIAKDSKTLVSQLINLFEVPQNEQVKIERGNRWAKSQTWDEVVMIYKKLWKK